jgi:hypothetical protein
VTRLKKGPREITVQDLERRRAFVSVVGAGAVLFMGLILAYFAQRSVPRAEASSIALLVLVVAICAAAVRPILGLYSIVFFTLIGDAITVNWFPFGKNLSSRESLLYLSDSLTLSPLEILVASTFAFFVVDAIGARKRIVTGPIFYATAAFTAFVAFGFMIGIRRGGDLRIALFEGRALFLILPVYVLAINLCTRSELRRVAWVAIAAIFINAMLALNYLNDLSPVANAEREDLGEHPASVHFNVVLLLTLVLFLNRGASRATRYLLLLSCVPVGWAYLEAGRRGAVVALIVGLTLVVLSLWWRQRSQFLVIAPVLFVATALYTGAFWNSASSAGFPAQAVKAVIVPGTSTEKDRSSDVYRQIENFNLNYTIRSSPLTGLGFGHQFYRPVPMPDISAFEFHQYIPHNSILWIWIKTGFGGFLAALLMFAVAIREGVRNLLSEQDRTHASFVMIGIAYTAMFAVFAFIDIAWDPRSLVYLGLSFALCARQSQPGDDEGEMTTEPEQRDRSDSVDYEVSVS